VYGTASYCTTVSFNVTSQAPVASGIGSTILDDPCSVSVPAGHATVRESGRLDGEVADTCIGPEPVKDCEADESSGSWRSPVHSGGSATGCAGAAAVDPLVDGVTVVTVVTVLSGSTPVAGVVEAAFTAAPVAVGTISLEVSGVVLGMDDFVDVAVDVAVDVVVDVAGGIVPPPWTAEVGGDTADDAAPFSPPEGATTLPSRCPGALGRSEAAAATRAKIESDTARTAHQWGRIRDGPDPTEPVFVISPTTG
jgi:hypothetical protein